MHGRRSPKGLRHFRYMSISVQWGGQYRYMTKINFGTRDFCSTVSVHRYGNFGT